MYIFKITEILNHTTPYYMTAENYTGLIQKLQELNKNVPQQIEIIAEQEKE